MVNSTKKCLRCGQMKSVEEYEKDSRCSTGRRNVCRTCRNNLRRKRYLERFPPGKRRPRNHAKEAEYARGKRRRHIATYLASGARKRAKKKNIPFTLDQHMDALILRTKPMKCELTGIPLRMADGTRDYDSISMDRVSPEAGYTIENIRIVCWAINAAAGTWGLNKAMEIFRKIKE